MLKLFSILAIYLLISVRIAIPQSVKIKPYFGYSTIRMDEVNKDIKLKVDQLNEITGQSLLPPAKFNGNYAWGIQIQYHLGENYFLHLDTYYMKEKTSSVVNRGATQNRLNFDFKRQIEYFEASFGLKYYLGYSTWKRLNFYLGGGAGYGFGWTESIFRYDDSISEINNSAEFSSNSLTAYFLGGIDIRITPFLSILPEFGYRVANLKQMNGKLKIYQDFPGLPGGQIDATDHNYTTIEDYDFSGYFVSIGLGFILSAF